MHFDAHVASEVSEIVQHIGEKFCVVIRFEDRQRYHLSTSL